MPGIELEINDRDLADLIRTMQRLDMQHIAVEAFKARRRDHSEQGKGLPASAPESSYRRTHNLFNRWYQRAFPTYLEIGNLATYAGWVHGEEQVEMHRQTGWKRLLQVATDELPEIIRKVEAQVERIWRGNA